MPATTHLGDLTARHLDLDRLALIDLRLPQAPVEYTHRQIDRLAGGVAAWLQGRGLKRGDAVAILSANRMEYIAAYFGIMRAGLVAVPVNVKLAPETVAHVLRDSGTVHAFVDAERRALVADGVAVTSFDDDGPDGWAAQIQPADFDAVACTPDDVAQILYTSGSTGLPKGVPLTHAGQLWALSNRPLPVDAHLERQIVAQPLFHMNGLMVTKGVFRAGQSMVLMPGFDTRAYTEAMARYGVTTVMAVPTMFARVVKELDGRADIDLSRLKRIQLGSAPITLAMFERIRSAIPSATLAIGYGTTEAGPSPFHPHPDGRPNPPLALGVAFEGSDVRLVGGATDDEGVLEMRNTAVMPGYLHLPEKTAKVVQDGWYTSGDAMPTATTTSSAAPTTCSCVPARTSIRAKSRSCWSGTPPCNRPRSCRCPTRSAARCRRRSSSCGRAATSMSMASSVMRWTTVRPTRTRAASPSCPTCPGPAPTRSIAMR